MTQYDMVELSFMADAPEASHVRIPMNAVIRNEKSVWQLDGFYATVVISFASFRSSPERTPTVFMAVWRRKDPFMLTQQNPVTMVSCAHRAPVFFLRMEPHFIPSVQRSTRCSIRQDSFLPLKRKYPLKKPVVNQKRFPLYS